MSVGIMQDEYEEEWAQHRAEVERLRAENARLREERMGFKSESDRLAREWARADATSVELRAALRLCAGILSGANMSKSCLIDALEAARAALRGESK